MASSTGGGSRPAGRLVGVGMGPGDPELVTRRAVSVLRSSDRVVAPSTAVDAVGRAEAIAREACPGLRTERLVFSMSATGSARERTSAYEDATERLLPWLDAGERLAFVTLGDPNVYSTFSSLAAAVRSLRPSVVIETVPGIMAFQALAASTGSVVLEATESLTLVTALDGLGALDSALREPDRAVLVYKGGRHLPAITEAVQSAGRLSGSVMGELLGLPGERTGELEHEGLQEATYLATVIVPPSSRARRFAPPGGGAPPSDPSEKIGPLSRDGRGREA
jgi:precorrin-2/cobalt-factor-2 C20-methyltransferase